MIKINNHFIVEDELDSLFADIEKVFIEREEKLEENAENNFKERLKKWSKDKTKIYSFKNIEACIQGLESPDEIEVKKITKAQLAKAKCRRMIHRIGRMYETAKKQIASIVPGVNELPKEQLLPLDHHYNEQRQRWQKTLSGEYVQLKPKGMLDETAISAFGNPQNPSMLYWRNDRQLGHRYQATPNNRAKKATRQNQAASNDDIYSYNHGQNRTYGGKKNTTGLYKVKGMTDGHGIQACDDQINLDPQDKIRYPTADTHLHNMYWENQAFGKSVRQKFFEAPVLKEEGSLLQVNEYKNYDAPTLLETHGGNANKPQNAIIADKVYIQAEKNDEQSCWTFNNKQNADYGDLTYVETHGDYKEVEWNAQLNKSLGGDPNKPKSSPKSPLHADANKRVLEDFPFAQVIDTGEAEFNSEFTFRHQECKDYDTPPPTPYYLSPRSSISDRNPDCFEGQEVTTQKSETISFIESVVDKEKMKVTTISYSPFWKEQEEATPPKAAKAVKALSAKKANKENVQRQLIFESEIVTRQRV